MAKTRKKAALSGARPVLQFRVHEDDYERLRASAAKHKFTISEEAAHQIKLAFDWEKTRIEMQRLTGTIEGVRELMESFKFSQVRLNLKDVIWTEPGVDIRRASESLDAAAIVKEMEPALAILLANAIKKVTQGAKQ